MVPPSKLSLSLSLYLFSLSLMRLLSSFSRSLFLFFYQLTNWPNFFCVKDACVQDFSHEMRRKCSIFLQILSFGRTMVLILEGTSIIGALVRSILCQFVCLRHSIRSRAVTNRIVFFLKISLFLNACQHVLSYHLI